METYVDTLNAAAFGGYDESPEQMATFDRLRKSQIVALRFASDEELPELMRRAVEESLSRTDIKKAVKNWVPDYHRT